MASESVNVRHLEQIQEAEMPRHTSRWATLLLASIGGAALVLVFVMMAKRDGPPARSSHDPLAELVAKAKQAGPPAEHLDGRDVSFPSVLSDGETPTTALAAVKDERGRLVKQPGSEDPEFALPAGTPTAPPPAMDRLPVVPLPVGTLLGATPVTMEPKDKLAQLARERSKPSPAGEMAPMGSDTGFQLQVASFKDQADADKLVEALRKRGHQAFRVAAMVPNKGLWHRVRVGPFKTKYQAVLYKRKFEDKERLAPFVVDPEKVERAAEIREAKLEARKRKYGRP